MDPQQLGELISAYVDGELDRRETEFVEHLLREDADARRLLEELRQTVSIVSSLPRHAAPGGIEADVQLQLERSELLGEQTTADTVPGRRPPLLGLLSMAATIGLVALGWWAMNLGDNGTSSIGHDQVALATKKTVFSPVNSEASSGKTVASRKRNEEADDLNQDARAASRDRLARAATIDQKLRAGGFQASVVKKHAFENETVRLDIPVRSAAERDRVVARLVDYLAAGSAQDIGSSSAAAMKGKTGAVGSYYYHGQPKVNFAKEGERQVLVHASRRELDGLMTELGRVTKRQDRVSLQAGPLTITGMKRAGVTLVYGLRDTPKVADKTESRSQSKQDRPSETKGTDDALTELLKGFGLPEDLTIARGKESGSLARAKTPKSSSRGRRARRNKTKPNYATEADAHVTSAKPKREVFLTDTAAPTDIDGSTTIEIPKVQANTPDEIVLSSDVDFVTTPENRPATVTMADGGESAQPSPTTSRSLVGRRLDALKMAQNDKSRTVTDDTPAEAFGDTEGTEDKRAVTMSADEDAIRQQPYVTLVFRIAIDSKRERAAHRTAKPPRKARGEKPSGDPRME